MAGLSGLRHRMEFPKFRASPRVERAGVAGITRKHLADDWCRFASYHRRWPAATPLTNTAAASAACSKAALIIGLLLFTTSPGRRRRPEPIAPCEFQFGNILRVDLRQRREPRAAEVAVV